MTFDLTRLDAEDIPAESGRQSTDEGRLTLPLLILIAAAECALAFTLTQAAAALVPVILIHFGLSLAVFLWWRLTRARAPEGSPRFPALLAMTLPLTGPFAAVGAMLGFLLFLHFRSDGDRFEIWYEALFATEESDPVGALYERIVSGRDLSTADREVASFSDILTYGTIEQKQMVITLLARHFRPEFAPALKRALAHPLPALRAQAAAALANIEDRFQTRQETLEHEVAARPRAAAAWLALASHHDDFAFAGLLDPERERDNRDRALRAYRRALELDPKLGDARVRVARLLVRQGAADEAARWIEQSRQDGHDLVALDDWYLEALYRLRRIDDLRATAIRRLEREAAGAPIPVSLRPAVLVWAGQNDASA